MVRTRLAALALGLALCSGAAGPVQADEARGRCISEAARAGLIGASLNPGDANFVGGTSGDDNFSGRSTPGRDVFCGFGGRDSINYLDPGDIFLGGAGQDAVYSLLGGTFFGGDDRDDVFYLYAGAFIGGPGNDIVGNQDGGTFDGGPGDDSINSQAGGTFDGGPGNDRIGMQLYTGTFNGGPGDDSIVVQYHGTFNGGPGNDSVGTQRSGTFNQD